MESGQTSRLNSNLKPSRRAHFFRHRRLLFAAGLFTSLFSTNFALAGDIECDGWKLEQWSRETGRLDVYVEKSAVRIFVPKSGMTVIASEPWQEAYIYCGKTGKIFKSPVAKFRNPYIGALALFDGGILADIKTVAKGPAKVKDISCQAYVETAGFSKRQLDKYKAGQVAARAPMHLEYMITNQLKVDPHVGQIMSKFYAVPTTSSVPLQFKFTSVKLENNEQLLTYSCKKIKIKASEFRLPPGLKAVNDGMKILTPDNSADGLDLMMMGTKVK